MNPYLVKIASKRKYSPAAETVAAGAGAAVISTSPSRMLGYHTVYHGTSSTAAEGIRKNGFLPGLGGTGAATVNPRYTENSKGKVHFTKTKLSARMYSGDPASALKKVHTGEYSKGEALSKILKDSFTKGKVVKSKIPHSMWRRMDVDADSSRGAPDHPVVQELMKERASTYSKRVSPTFVEGSSSYGGRSMYATKKNLKRYLSSASGMSRAAGGVARLGLGTTVLLGAAHHNLSHGGLLAKLRNDSPRDSK